MIVVVSVALRIASVSINKHFQIWVLYFHVKNAQLNLKDPWPDTAEHGNIECSFP